MNEQNQTTIQNPLINLLVEDGLQSALPGIAEILMNAATLLEREAHIGATPWQHCQFHLQQNAQEYVTKQHLKSKIASDIRDIFHADDLNHAQQRLKDFIKTYSQTQPRFATWAEENLPEGFVVFAFPEAHRKRLRTFNVCENVNAQIKKRTRVVDLFPSMQSLERLVTGILIEISET